MKKFDLEAAKAGAPVCTRDGRPVRIICWDKNDDEFPVVALIDCYGYEEIITYTTVGCYHNKEKEELGSEKDLFMAPTKHTAYVAIHRGDDGVPRAHWKLYADRASAEKIVENIASTIAICKVTWED